MTFATSFLCIATAGFVMIHAPLMTRVVGTPTGVFDQQAPRNRAPDRPTERKPVFEYKIPYPGSVQRNQVVANIKALLEQTSFGSEIPELREGSFRATRILNVKSELYAPGYLVAELEDLSGNFLCTFGLMASGRPLGVVDSRGFSIPRPLEVSDATSRVHAKLAAKVLSAEYVYFHNQAEPGFSVFRPLVAVRTDRGEVFLNSKGEAFVEDESPLAAELNAAPPPPPGLAIQAESLKEKQAPVSRGVFRTLRSVGVW